MIERKGICTLVIMSLASISAETGSGVFDVTDYGAKADGQSDCTAAIRKAIAGAAQAGGGKILIPPAEKPYLISDSIELHADNLHLVGTGATVYLKNGSAVGRTDAETMLHIIKINGTKDDPVDNISVAGLTIDANYWGQTDGTAAWQASAKIAGVTRGIQVGHAHKVLIDNVAIKRSFVGMTFGLGSHNCEARDVKVTQFHHDGFGVTPERVDGGASNITFLRCLVADSLHGRNGGLPGHRVKGWEIEEGAHNVKVIDCVVRNTDAHGFFVRPHWSRKGKYDTKNIELIRCRVENAGKAAFMIKGFNHQQRVMNVKIIDCYSDTGTFQIMMNPDNVLVSGGHFGSMTIGFYLDIADDHHFPDGPWDWTYNFLPVRSLIVENVTVAGDIRINAIQGNDAANDYTPDISLNKVTVKSDLYTVGSESLVKMIDCSIKGTHYLKTAEDYLENTIKPAKP